MATKQMQMRMTKKKHRKLMLDQCIMLTTALGTSDVNGCECVDGDDADMDEEQEATPDDDGSMQNLED